MKFGFAIVTLSEYINYKSEKNIVIYSTDELLNEQSSTDLKDEVRSNPQAWYGNMKVNLVKGKMPNKGTIMLTSSIQQMFGLPDVFTVIDGNTVVNPEFLLALKQQYVVEITESAPREGKDGKHYRRYNFSVMDKSIWPAEQWSEIFNGLRMSSSKLVDVSATVDMEEEARVQETPVEETTAEVVEETKEEAKEEAPAEKPVEP